MNGSCTLVAWAHTRWEYRRYCYIFSSQFWSNDIWNKKARAASGSSASVRWTWSKQDDVTDRVLRSARGRGEGEWRETRGTAGREEGRGGGEGSRRRQGECAIGCVQFIQVSKYMWFFCVEVYNIWRIRYVMMFPNWCSIWNSGFDHLIVCRRLISLSRHRCKVCLSAVNDSAMFHFGPCPPAAAHCLQIRWYPNFSSDNSWIKHCHLQI